MGLLRPSLSLSLKPRQRLTPTFSTEATVLATTAMASATMVLGTGPTATTARGELRLSPRLPLILTCCTEATGPTATATATPTAMAITTARGRLRLRPILTSMVATTVMDWATVTATVLATGDTTTDKLL